MKKAPDFNLPDQAGNNVSLKDLKGRWFVLYFYPRDNTPGCTIEAVEFTASLSKFKRLGVEILGVSPDSQESHCKFIKNKDLKIRLLSDPDHKVMEKYKVWGKKKFMGREFMGVIRSTFIIDPKRNIACSWSPVKVKGHVEAVLSKAKDLV